MKRMDLFIIVIFLASAMFETLVHNDIAAIRELLFALVYIEGRSHLDRCNSHD